MVRLEDANDFSYLPTSCPHTVSAGSVCALVSRPFRCAELYHCYLAEEVIVGVLESSISKYSLRELCFFSRLRVLCVFVYKLRCQAAAVRPC